ncbi:uncharacterized protein LOC109830528 isoform X2 [Asparagus officinalis]|uniref:uncharacterized protein LOC109830528 isoform X2 n=1 Tax=Asparagus officinalis TaxID=4686 RepID=UPI00098E346E|nr:uncharacterized protein LOC109830528 isoform X2 [Asparagus officinalis]
MPPSPALRCSPGWEHRTENTHKRGHSLEGGLRLKAKDDDLALFNDMQNKEKETFLLHTVDDFDDSLSKLRYLSDFKISIPARGESSDLLNLDGEKNDYEWLLTPPETPLFHSLDDEDPQPQNLPSRGRPRSQPINVSRSSSMNEKTHRSSRSSASPHRLSPSPRSSNNFGQLTSRPSSAPRSSPPPVVRPVTPSRRSSTPPIKPTATTPRSSTPTPRRMSTGSNAQASSSGRRGSSPMRASRGNSASPKLRGWQSTLPGFSSDAPPNLRTSLSNRPSPHDRGLSPTPRTGRGRHSMSPTASRSTNSSYSNDRDLFSSYSKGSVVSSGDDDMDSLHSMVISSSLPARRNGMSVNSRPMAFSKKPSRPSPSNSVPKRSFESAIRQMDQRKTPQNMFRPLVSSVPSSTFYVGKANNTYRPMFSRNSSFTTSTNASTDRGAIIAPDMEGGEHDQWERTHDPDTQEEVFIFDKVDETIEDTGQESHAGNPLSISRSSDTYISNRNDAPEFEGSGVNFRGVTCTTVVESTSGDSYINDVRENMEICSQCGTRFPVLGVDGNVKLCQDCTEVDGLLAEGEPSLHPMLAQTVESEVTTGMGVTAKEMQLTVGVHQLPERSNGKVILGHHENKTEEGLSCLDKSCPVQSMVDQSESHPFNQQLERKLDGCSTHSDNGNKFEQTEPTLYPSHRINNAEGTGISALLLQQSSGSKWPVVQSRAFSVTNILYGDSSFARDDTSVLRKSIGQDSFSPSSSVDLGSSRQIEAHIRCQISCRKSEMESVRSDTDAKSQCSGSYSDLAINAYESSVPTENEIEWNFNSPLKGIENDPLQKSGLLTAELDGSSDRTNMSAANLSSCRADFGDSDAHISADCFVGKDTYDAQLLSHMERHYSETLEVDNLKDEDCLSRINADEGPGRENKRSSLDVEVSNSIPDSLMILEQSLLNDPSCQSDVSDAVTNSSSLVILESRNNHDSFQDLQIECEPANNPSEVEVFHEHSASTISEKGVLVSVLESDLDDCAHGTQESTVIVEGPRGHTLRSLTLAEATDTILFCSSIIHDIAYKAATIGMEKEAVVPLEPLRPTVALLGNSVDQKDSRKSPTKNTPKSQKFKRKKLETPTKSPLKESGNNVIIQESSKLPANAENISNNAPDSIKPPKLESKCNCTVM